MNRIKKFKFDKDINLYCFTDVHIGADEFEEKKFNSILKEVIKDKRGFCFFNGDTLEFTPAGYHDATYTQTSSNTEQVKYFVNKVLKPLRSKVLFFRAGNHEDRAAKLCDVDIFSILSNNYKVPQLSIGMEAIKLQVKTFEYQFVSTHGLGGGSKKTLSAMESTFPMSHVYFTGHTHELYSDSTKSYIKTNKNVEEFHSSISICGGSFLSFGKYAREKNLRPTTTGCFVLSMDSKGKILERKYT